MKPSARYIYLILIAILSAVGCDSSRIENTKPNFIFIMSDDHANRTISAYGDSINHTPNIDRLATEGAIFINSFCANSICAPSRSSILTGKHNHKNGVYTNGSPWYGSQTQFPRIFKKNGYETALIGKWHLNSDPGDEYDYFKILTGAGRQGFYYNPSFLSSEKGNTDESGYSTDLVTKEAINWLRDIRDPSKPFLPLVQYKAVHVPRMPEFRFLENNSEDSIPEPETLYDDYEHRARYAREVNMFIWKSNLIPPYRTYDLSGNRYIYFARMTEEERKRYHAYYDPWNAEYEEMKAKGMLAGDMEKKYWYQRFIKDYLRVVDAIDENVGKLVDFLDAGELAENTIVIYCSDQSYFTGEHGWAEKMLMYEEALQMPLLMRWPGKIFPGTRIQGMVQNIDYAPTLLDIAGLEIPEEMQGRSFVPILDEVPPDDWRKSIYYHYYEHGGHGVPRHEGVRSQRYKLINYYTDNVWEFFDLEKDPDEMQSVYNDPYYEVEIRSMKEELLRLRSYYEIPDSVFVPPFVK
ncbi:MAG: sulfatase [Cyclobacteriaceae bacterium]|nr:sulfatase [Cyclobacteriaceae bacterium]